MSLAVAVHPLEDEIFGLWPVPSLELPPAGAISASRVSSSVGRTRGILRYLFVILTAKPLADAVQIPNRSLFRQPEVCEIAHVQPYVLRSWEAEFSDLGVAKTQGGPRVYRRTDVERVLRIKHLLFVEGLTIAGARRRLQDEQPAPPPDASDLDDLLSSDARERILSVRATLRELAAMLAGKPGEGAGEFVLQAPAVKARPARATASAAKAPVKKTPKKK
jgi:DNA-binding transcriptional MerR regulator